MEGDLVVFNSMSVLQMTGLLDLRNGAVAADARTPKILEKVLDSEAAAWAGRVDPDKEKTDPKPSIGIRTGISLFGAKLFSTNVRADLEGQGRLEAGAMVDTPIGGGKVAFESDLGFGEAKLDANVEAVLFGWEALEAGIKADPDWANARLKVLWFELNTIVAMLAGALALLACLAFAAGRSE